MSSFDTFNAIMEIQVTEEMETSTVTAFRHQKSEKDLDFGIIGMWLVDLEGFKMDCSDELPKVPGKYRFVVEWNDEREMIGSILSVEKVEEVAS